MSRVELTALYPKLPGEDPVAWTGRVLSHAQEHGTNRQCSIGWHEECSDPYGYSCQCLCHDGRYQLWSVEGHAEDGDITITRVEEGTQSWPAQEGEPETMWAHWIYASDEDEARNFATAKQRIILDAEGGQ